VGGLVFPFNIKGESRGDINLRGDREGGARCFWKSVKKAREKDEKTDGKGNFLKKNRQSLILGVGGGKMGD